MQDFKFPKEFIWGTATASYQIEGAVNEDGRGMSIWDTFSHTQGKTAHGDTGDIACDHYHRYPEDLKLMRDLGVNAYRFSIAWPRIFPEGSGRPNTKGTDFYNRLIDGLLEKGIEPVITLYHWDLPQALEDAGGWQNRDTAYRFADFADHMFDKLDDRAHLWITLNEPYCSAYLGHLSGEHAPGIQDPQAAYSALHHLLLAHGLALGNYREAYNNNPIGIALNISTPQPASEKPEDSHAADAYLDHNTRMFLDPIYKKNYPQKYLEKLKSDSILLPVKNGDLEVISGDIDFLGLNYYFEVTVSADKTSPDGYRLVDKGYPKTAMGWDIVPEGLLRQLKWVSSEYGNPAVYITENGAAFPDSLSENGRECHDPDRIEYLTRHFSHLKRALKEGVNLKGYFLWSFIDNFEWAYGYDKRFGIVYCDFNTQERIPKESYYFYRDYITSNTE